MAETLHCPDTRRVLGNGNLALLVRQLHYWHGLKNSGVLHRGYAWIYKSYQDWQRELFPDLSIRTIQRFVQVGRKAKVLATSRKLGYPLLYRLDYHGLRIRFASVGADLPLWVPRSDGVQLSQTVEIDLQEAMAASLDIGMPISKDAEAMNASFEKAEEAFIRSVSEDVPSDEVITAEAPFITNQAPVIHEVTYNSGLDVSQVDSDRTEWPDHIGQNVHSTPDKVADPDRTEWPDHPHRLQTETTDRDYEHKLASGIDKKESSFGEFSERLYELYVERFDSEGHIAWGDREFNKVREWLQWWDARYWQRGSIHASQADGILRKMTNPDLTAPIGLMTNLVRQAVRGQEYKDLCKEWRPGVMDTERERRGKDRNGHHILWAARF